MHPELIPAIILAVTAIALWVRLGTFKSRLNAARLRIIENETDLANLAEFKRAVTQQRRDAGRKGNAARRAKQKP